MVIPLAFHSPNRANGWSLFDEDGKRYFLPANPTKMLLRLHGGTGPGAALVFIDTDAGGNALPSVKTVPMDFSLAPAETSKVQNVEAHDFFAPELARIFRRQVAVLNRVVPNFICTSTKQPQPGDTWASLKPGRPQLYPNAPKFNELPAADATALVKLYDSLQEISDILDSYREHEIADVNAWNVLMHRIIHNLALGEEAIRRFCTDEPLHPGSPAAGTLIQHSERAKSGAQAALKAHLARHGVA
jgi:hypothetical protein